MIISRRRFLYGSLALPAFAAKPTGDQPNILLILADGVGAWMLGCYGNKELRTPHIDSLAANGTRFLNHYASAPVASAGRQGLLTGGSSTSLEKALAAAGYACQSTTGADDALKFIDSQSSGKPFLLISGFTSFQSPADARFLAPYAQSKFGTWAHEAPAKNAVRNQQKMSGDLDANLRQAAAQTAALDEHIGALTAAITSRKLTDRTLVIFTAPCGSLLSAHGLWGDGDASDPINMYEEVVNTPMLWMWPGRTPPGALRPEMIGATDLLPTLSVVAGAELTMNELAGSSYVSLATGVPLPKKQRWKTTVYARYKNTTMARTDRYKLVMRDEGKGPGELYDDRQDPKERVNQYDNPQFMTVKSALRGK